MRLSILVALFLNFTLIYAQEYKTIVAEADQFYKDKIYDKSVSKYIAAFNIEKKNPLDLYNAGCAASLMGDENLAFEWLNLALTNGWSNVNHLKTDSDLTALHGNEKWSKLVNQMQEVVDKREANYDKPLQAKLLAIFDDDQHIRRQYIAAEKEFGFQSTQVDSLAKIMMGKDSANLNKVTEILDSHGWVGAEKVGGQANQTLFLVIQHADLATQQKYLPMMRTAVNEKRANGSALALLEDRVALGEGRRQVYGSQIARDNDSQKHFVLPLDDPDNVDKRRAAVGLGPLAEYVLRWDIIWDIEEYKKLLPEIESKQSQHK